MSRENLIKQNNIENEEITKQEYAFYYITKCISKRINMSLRRLHKIDKNNNIIEIDTKRDHIEVNLIEYN